MRKAQVERTTKETKIKISLNLDGKGESKIEAGNPFFEHLLNSLAFHGRLDLEVSAKSKIASGDHHLVEDVGILLGQALDKALDSRAGINRFGSAIIPMDDALLLVAVDLSGRTYFKSNLKFTYPKVEELSSEMINHFLKSFAEGGKFNLHVKCFRGVNDHHKAEAAFKALGKTLAQAVKIDETRTKEIPSTKGTLTSRSV